MVTIEVETDRREQLVDITDRVEEAVASGGRPVLGRWQGVFLCEFDGPRTRRVALRLLASG